MLRPQANRARDLVSLDGVWNFALAKSHDIETEQAWTKRISPELQVPVPASYNDIFADETIRDHVGWVYYQRQAVIPRGWVAPQRVFLRVDAATHHGRVYVNDKFVVEHIGGYTPFEIELTGLVEPGSEFRLTIAVNNQLTWETIPPGRIEVQSDGSRKQSYQHDFFNYAGLARSVWLYSAPKVFINDISVVTDVHEDGTGIVEFDIQTSGELQADARWRILLDDEEDTTVCRAQEPHGKLEVKNAKYWAPGAAYLYQLRAQIVCGEQDEILDSYNLHVGIRSVEVRDGRFLINGKPFYFTGFGKHEDGPVRGRGYDASYMIHDYRLMKWIGANSFRTSHYPYAEEVLEYADRHGVVVINETAAVGLNLNIVSGMFGNKQLATFSPDTMSSKTQASHEQAIRELISRDKNHPCVVMWMLANEPGASEQGSREYFEPLVTLARSLDSQKRPMCYSHMIHSKPDTDRIADLFDVVCMNRYYGWYTQTGNLKAAEVALEAELRSWQEAYSSKPIIMTEYGTDTVAGLHTVCDVPWTEEYQVRFLDMYHRVFDRIDNIVGEHVWNFADFQTSAMIIRVDGNKKGIFTRDRRPKSAAHALRARWTGPVGLRKINVAEQ
ncbi:hypothetical protein NXS19_012774 [Fusarium pseudograminearum]|uniref:Beta-glucuronidase n=1 Tax=Fusarium pseudograminearum (strain CS3096) TaxID=1028729 RepID=K3UIS1_FUSPC|nr:hypothetical protein FPSE_08039 [Fusarium pseudograminearum CS3096]EKJ71771.1 hypothetical protein FPSE_08039 [Fusarium pseudograminearum CS3096]KAF0639420.1 hypothetical protein FPSE5266_08039 [Fusarium pseudograminearum]UZP44962.1 hypothetical protein NXS19_012774 [Fusarium pseudograminearum]